MSAEINRVWTEHFNERFRYEYDFGAGWELELRIERTLPLVAQKLAEGVFLLSLWYDDLVPVYRVEAQFAAHG